MYRSIQTTELIDDLANVYDIARATPKLSVRWKNALEKAWDYVLQQDALRFDVQTGILIYHSESGVTYQAGKECQCKAFEEGYPCKHRAAARLVRNAVQCLSEREMAELFDIAA